MSPVPDGATEPGRLKRALAKASAPLSGLGGEQQGYGIIEVDRWLR